MLTLLFELLAAGRHPLVLLKNASCVAQVPTAVKVELIDRLSAAGLPTIEATSFVSPKSVTQLADAADVLRGVTRCSGVRYPVLTQNVKARPYPVHCTFLPLTAMAHTDPSTCLVIDLLACNARKTTSVILMAKL